MKKLIISCAVILTAVFGVSCNKEESNDPYAKFCYLIEAKKVVGGIEFASTTYFWGNEIQLEAEIEDIKWSYHSMGVEDVMITSKRTDKTQEECKAE